MKKVCMVFTVMLSTVLFNTAVFAAAWYVPTNVRVVQKSNTDTTGRIYSNIQTAINSITTASATNPYVVKVMPGIYDLGTASLQMKEYVDLEGSGADSTVITSSNYSVDGCTVGTVLMANNSTIRNAKVVNTPPLSGGGGMTAALVFNNVKAKAEGISVLTGSDTIVPYGDSIGVCTYGSAPDAFLNNVTIEGHINGMSQTNLVLVMSGSLTVTNSKMAGFGGIEGMSNLINEGGSAPGNITINNCTIEGTNPGGYLRGIYSGINKVTVSNSTITLNVGNGTAYGFGTGNDFTMVNARIVSDSPTLMYDHEGNAKISNSLLPGDKSSLISQSNVKLINNYDENFNAIPNQ